MPSSRLVDAQRIAPASPRRVLDGVKLASLPEAVQRAAKWKEGEERQLEMFGSDRATVAYYLRLFVLGGLPLSEPESSEVVRKAYGGALKLTFVSPREVGLPYGRTARLIVLWLTTQVVRSQERLVRLGSSFHRFCGMI